MPDQNRDLLDALRFRIADPGAYLPRRFADGEPAETIAFWAARAIAAALEDGTLGYVPATQQLHRADFDHLAAERDRWKNHSTTVQAETDRLAVELATLKRHAHHLFAGVNAAYLFANKLDADCCGTYAQQLRDAIGKADPAPVPGSSRRVPEPTFAQGYAEAVARLRDDARYLTWWTSGGVKPDGPLRGHLADYLETVGPDGIDVETGRWPAREQAVIRAAIAWRKWASQTFTQDDWSAEDSALIEAVDSLPNAERLAATEPEPAAPKLAQGGIIRSNKLAMVGEQTDGCIVLQEADRG